MGVAEDEGRASGIARALRIGSLVITTPVILAPMAGVTDLSFRRIARRFGVGLVVSEMLASRSMVGAHPQTLRMADTCDDEQPLAVQIVGRDPGAMAEAARIACGRGARLIDINMGCPVKKVVGGYAGAALMRDEPLAGRIIDAVVRAVDVPVTVKMRAGWEPSARNAARLARIAWGSGAAMVTVHGRTRDQFYDGRADWSVIAEVKAAVPIPVIGNGDVATAADARQLMAETGADGVMIGRAALGRPWLPGRIGAALVGTGQGGGAGGLSDGGAEALEPGAAERCAIVLEHLEATMARHGEGAGLRMMRKHLAWYAAAVVGPGPLAAFRAAINRADTALDVRRRVRDLFADIAPSGAFADIAPSGVAA